MAELPVLGPASVDERLAALGLRRGWLEEAIRAGEEARRTATPNEPPTAAGLKAWIARVGSLREQLKSEGGWRRLNQHNVALVCNQAKTIAVGVLQGDGNTGVSYGKVPRSRYPKGAVVAAMAARNSELTLFSLAEAGRPDLLEEDEFAHLQTWFLLTYRCLVEGRVQIRGELSVPSKFDVDGYINDWRDRIILPPMEFEPVVGFDDGLDGEGGVDVAVEEKDV